MNYSKTIREYCMQNPGMIFDMSYEHKKHFEMVPYRTFCKILNRIEEEGIIKTSSKGIYLINADNMPEDPVIAFYANTGFGVVVGYHMYNRLGITTHNEKPIIIYTSVMETTTKNIGDDYKLVLFDTYFDPSVKKLIICLELIENRNKIIGIDLYKTNTILIDYLKSYYDSSLEQILKNHKYQYATIVTLDEMLGHLKIKNKALEIALKYYKHE